MLTCWVVWSFVRYFDFLCVYLIYVWLICWLLVWCFCWLLYEVSFVGVLFCLIGGFFCLWFLLDCVFWVCFLGLLGLSWSFRLIWLILCVLSLLIGSWLFFGWFLVAFVGCWMVWMDYGLIGAFYFGFVGLIWFTLGFCCVVYVLLILLD